MRAPVKNKSKSPRPRSTRGPNQIPGLPSWCSTQFTAERIHGDCCTRWFLISGGMTTMHVKTTTARKNSACTQALPPPATIGPAISHLAVGTRITPALHARPNSAHPPQPTSPRNPAPRLAIRNKPKPTPTHARFAMVAHRARSVRVRSLSTLHRARFLHLSGPCGHNKKHEGRALTRAAY